MSTYQSIPRHKRFDEVLPYTYYIKQRSTGLKYYGVRWANRSAPRCDLGVAYFTSGVLSESYRTDPGDFDSRIHYTFNNKSDALLFESLLVNKIAHRSDWANGKCFPWCGNTAGATRGRKWYNDGQKNYLKYATEDLTGLVPGRKLSEASKDKIVNGYATKGKRSWYNDGVKNFCIAPDDSRCQTLAKGIILSDEAKKKMSEGVKRPEVRKKISESLKGKYSGKNSANYGKTWSEETRKKQRLAQSKSKPRINSKDPAGKHSRANSKNNKGRKAYNDGIKNYRLKADDPRIKDLVPGMLISDERRQTLIARNKSPAMRAKVSAAKRKVSKH